MSFLSGGGVAGECVRAIDWSSTAIGPMESWPASLRTIVGIILHARNPMFLWWGPDLIQFYNDAYVPSFGTGKHPTAMGQRGRDCWPEIWPIIGPQIEGVMESGISTWNEDQLVPIFRNGKIEDVYWTYGYSPVYSETGIGGTLVNCAETTVRVVAERRLQATRTLGQRVSAPAPDAADDVFVGMTTDVPFAVLYTAEIDDVRLTAASGLSAADELVAVPWFRERARAWVADAVPGSCSNRLLAAPELSRAGLAPEAYFSALTTSACSGATGYVAFGINARLPFDTAYRTHLDELASVLAQAQAHTVLRESQEKSRQQLMISDRMASVGTLAAGVAHEINNPLTFVTANLEMILEDLKALGGAAPSAQLLELQEMVVDAHEGAARVSKIVRGLKTFSRTGEERRASTDLRPVLELSITMAFNEIRHRARLVKDYGVTPLVDVDDARLGQVFVNLLVNAAQAIPEGSAETNEIRITTTTDASGRAIIEIRDTGPGIPEAVLGRIFDPFFTTKEIGVGTGLGLSICHNIITTMGGEITVATHECVGTTFRIALPPIALAGPAEPSLEPPAHRATVLVVDDEDAIRIVVTRALRGHDLTVVTSVDDALAAITSGIRFDVILSDLMMPNRSGMDFYDQVKRQFPDLAQRIVFVTGGAFTPAARLFLDNVSNECLAKPFTVKGLRELVERFAALAG